MSTEPVDRSGPLGWMAQHPVASNLIMAVLILAGILGVFRTKQEVFPEFNLDMIVVSVPYPGASPAEVEQGIVLALEEAVRGIEGVKRINSTANEGTASLTIELLLDAQPDQVLAEVKNEVDRIQSFPEEAEEPTVSLAKQRQEVVSLVLAGELELTTLHAMAEQTRQTILTDERVSQVEVEGIPPLEISIEVPREELEKYGLTLDEVALQVTRASLELPGGGLETKNGEILVRVADRRLSGSEFEDIIVRSTAAGAEIRLGDIATIHDGFEDTDQKLFFNGQPAVRLTAYRIGDETPLEVAAAVQELAKRMERELPDGISVAVWNDQSEVLRDRMDLMLRNAGYGLILVVVILALFLDLRLAFWVGLGIPISFLGSFVVLGSTDFSINMISLFAFIVTLGMVVDDAIVVGERAFSRMQEGLSPRDAAISAAKEMAPPVTFAILTTVAAFSPLFFVPGIIGKFFSIIPAVVISVLLLSLLESFLILPAHLAHSKARRLPRSGIAKLLAAGPLALQRGLQWMTLFVYKPTAHALVRVRYVTLAGGLALLILTIGLVGSGRVPWNFFPVLEGDIVTVRATMPFGTPIERTSEVQRELERSAKVAVEHMGAQESVRGMLTYVGQSVPTRGPGPSANAVGTHLTGVELMLEPSETRGFPSAEIAKVWRENTAEIAGLESLNFGSSNGPGAGEDVAVQLIHPDPVQLAAASADLDAILRTYPQLKNVKNEYSVGKSRLDYHLRPEARALGLTGNDLARQLRGAFYGAEAIREQRGRNEIRVMVRLPEAQRVSESDLDRFRVRTPRGGDVPLGYVAEFERNTSPTTINREDGQRKVTVSAALAEGVESSSQIVADLGDNGFVELRDKYPGLNIGLVGIQREQIEAGQSLLTDYAVAMFVIFALLAIPFRSYLQPLIIMAVIPFGIVGAVAGHMLMGYGMSIMSVFGIVALSGVVVNDSLVLIDATNKLRASGVPALEAIIGGGASRLRPILLTSLTTFFGLVPMISETSLQAKFLIPMALSLGFGVLFVTFVVLLYVPALYMIVEDIRGLFARTPVRSEQTIDLEASETITDGPVSPAAAEAM